jgi:Domain of unknown function (DUF4276)
MVRQITTALQVEGSTDERFLAEIIRRTLEKLVAYKYDVLEPRTLNLAAQEKDRQILEAAKKAYNYDILIIHADADDSTRTKAYNERFLPGANLVKQEKVEEVCRQIVPLIPVRMIEAWMLADQKTLLEEIGIDISKVTVSLPRTPKGAEKTLTPKQTIESILAEVNKNRTSNRKIKLGTLYEPIATKISLEVLEKLPSYQQFQKDLGLALTRLGLLPP